MGRKFTPFRETKSLKSTNPLSPPSVSSRTDFIKGGKGDYVEIAALMALIAALLAILLLGGQDKTVSIDSKTT